MWTVTLFLASSMALFNASAAQSDDARQETLKNLTQALQGETTAAQKYQEYATQAEREGHPQIAELFRAASKSESIHRENHKAAIADLGGTVPDLKPQKVAVKSTKQNLEEPIRAEAAEKNDMYPRFMRQAKAAGSIVAVKSFEDAKNAEAQHEKLFKQALKEFGKYPDLDYYVNKRTGDTLAVKPGVKPQVSHLEDYTRIG